MIGLLPPTPLDLAFLNGPQQLGLQVEPQVADFVEEQCAVRGQLELAELLPNCAGERAALVAEQHALGEVRRDGREVDGDERRFRVAGLAMNQPRQQFLAGAALAENQHGGGQLGDLLHQVDDVVGDLAAADHELAVVLVGNLR